MSLRRQGPVRAADFVWLLVITGFFLGFYLYAAGSWGFWEPWETDYAQIGRRLSTVEDFDMTALAAEAGAEPQEGAELAWQRRLATWVAPEDTSGSIVKKPWLTAVLLQVGYGIGGGSEFGLRLPFAGLGILALLFLFSTLRSFVGPHRAGAAALITGTSPLFFMSSVSLAGSMVGIAVTSMAICAYAMALCRKGNPGWLVLAGLLTGACVWAGGVHHVVMVLGTVAGLAIWELQKEPRALRNPMSIGLAVLVFLPTVGYGCFQWFAHGFTENKDLIGLLLPVGLTVTAIALATSTGAFKRHGVVGWLLAVGAVLAVAVPPMQLYLQTIPQADFADLVAGLASAVDTGSATALASLSFAGESLAKTLLYNDFLSGSTLGDHVSFDTYVRQIGFSTFPYAIFVPFGLAYLTQTVSKSAEEGLVAGSADAQRASVSSLKVLMLIWFGVGIGLVAVSATLAHHFQFYAVIPMTVGVGLMLTDLGYWRELRKNRAVHALVGLIAICLLMVLTKDLKTTQDLEFGQRGPEVLFEMLLVDGSSTFPSEFELGGVRMFRAFWLLLFAVYFWFLLGFQDRLPDVLARFSSAKKRKPVDREVRKALVVLFGPIFLFVPRLLVRIFVPPLRLLAVVLTPVRLAFRSATFFAVAMVLSGVAFAAVTTSVYLPDLSNHLSHRGLIDTYKTVAREGEVFYWVGGSRSGSNYYLGEDTVRIDAGVDNPVDEIRSNSGLRSYFCENSERMFALIDRDSLPQAYYEVMRGDDEDCNPERDFWVLDGRSSRYVLVSNQLQAEREDGVVEENQNPLLEHIFTAENLPDLLVPDTEYSFDGKLRLAGYRLLDEEGAVVESAESGDVLYLETFFEVTERVTSNREMFIHVDFGGQRINGDHDVCDGEFPMNYWVPGEVVRDRFELTVERASAAGEYDIMIGFFSGDNRMTVRPAVGDNRVRLGALVITGGL